MFPALCKRVLKAPRIGIFSGPEEKFPAADARSRSTWRFHTTVSHVARRGIPAVDTLHSCALLTHAETSSGRMATVRAGESPWKKARLPSRQACETCRRRKQRCDGKRPACSNCDSRGIGTFCEYTGRTATESSTVGIRAAEADPPAVEQADPAVGIATGTPPPVRAGGAVGAQSPCSPIVQPPHEQAFYGDSSTFRFVSKLNAANPLERHLLRPGRRQSSLHRSRPDVNASLVSKVPPENDSDVPPREVADRLVDAYFDRVHIFYPCLHEPTFRTDLDAYWTGSNARETPATDPSWLAILYMLFAYGTEFVIASAVDQRARNADNFVAQARYFVSLAVSHGAGLETVQALLLLTHYLQGTTELNDCWNLAGLLIRTAMSIGLHIDPTEASLSLVEKEVRKRVWAGCFIVDRTLSMKFGRPPAIPIASVNRVELPANVDDQYITSSTSQARQPEARPSRMGFFVQTITQAHIIDKILSDLYLDEPELQRLGRSNDSFQIEVLSRLLSKVVVLDGRLHGWWNDLPTYLREAPEEPDGIDFHRQRCVISLR